MNFDEWVQCYEEYWDYYVCESETHSDHYDCFWYGESYCEDSNWYDCYWYGESCTEDVELDPYWSVDYSDGYVDGYVDGYTDGVIDTSGPEPVEYDEFLMEMLIGSFEDWVQEQEMRAGRFHCGHDIRIDFPFDDTDHMALWAAHDCEDWDLYLTLVMERDDTEYALSYTGAEPSWRRGCYETMWFDDVDACEFYLPHGGDNFGILFTGGFHAVWYEYEWEYAPTWDSWFGDW